jgi:hypothetical protein
MLPLDPYTDIAGALDYTEGYAARLPSARPKKVVFVTDGDQNPAPGTAAAMDAGALETRINETAARLRRNGTDFHLITFPRPVQPAPSAAEPPPPEPPGPPPAAREQPDTLPEPPDVQREEPPDDRVSASRGFSYIPLFAGLGAAALLISGLIIFLMTRKLKASPNRTMAYAAGRQKEETPPVTAVPVIRDKEESLYNGSLLLALVVDDQNTGIGRRNVHSLKAGDVYTVGGGKSDDYLIFLVPVPAHIGEIHFNGGQCTFVPKKPEYFPETGSRPIPGCIGKIIRVISDKGYELTFHFERYEDPLDSLNRLLNSVPLPPKAPDAAVQNKKEV